MRLQTKVLLASGCLRFGIPAALVPIAYVDPIIFTAFIPFIGLWLIYGRYPIRQALLPPLFAYTRCPACRYVIPLRQIWGIEGGGYNDHKPRHVLQFHDNEGNEIKSFQCPRKSCTKATIQIQKGIDSKVKNAVILGNAFAVAPDEKRPGVLRRVWYRWNRTEDKLSFPIGFDRHYRLGTIGRLIRRAFGWSTVKQISIPEDVYGRHMMIFGKSGMGKSKLILGLAQWIFENGMGATFVDKAGDLANEIIRIVPKERQDDVIWIRVADSACPFQFNILRAHDDDEAIDLNEELLHSLKQMSLSWGENIANDIEMGIETAVSIGGSLKTVYDLFANSTKREQLLRDVDKLDLLEYWDQYERRTATSTAAVKRKLRRLVKHKRLGPMLSARKSNFDADAIVRERKIVVVDLSTGSASQQVNLILGTFLIGKIRAAAFRQQFMKESERVRHWLIVDEAKNFMHKGMDFEKIFSEARKFKLSLVLANQNVGQMNEEVRNEAFGNAGVLATFNVDNNDAKLFADRMPNVTGDDITMQGIGECVVKIHNDAHFIRTQLPTIPDYDPTPYIKAKMQAMNANREEGDDDDDDFSVAVSAYAVDANTVEVCEGVR